MNEIVIGSTLDTRFWVTNQLTIGIRSNGNVGAW